MKIRWGLIISVLFYTFNVWGVTRMYFPEATNADVNPAFAVWSDTSEGLRRKWVSAKGSSAITIGQVVDGSNTGSTTDLDRQYVSAPLNGAQTISGTVKGVLMVREYAGTDNLNSTAITLKVVNNAGSSTVCTLLPIGDYFTLAEFVNNATHRNKQIADGDTITSCNASDDDRLVLEVAYRVASGGGTTPQGSAKWGENATDCAENETNTTNCAGWFEFSANLSFKSARRVIVVE